MNQEWRCPSLTNPVSAFRPQRPPQLIPSALIYHIEFLGQVPKRLRSQRRRVFFSARANHPDAFNLRRSPPLVNPGAAARAAGFEVITSDTSMRVDNIYVARLKKN